MFEYEVVISLTRLVDHDGVYIMAREGYIHKIINPCRRERTRCFRVSSRSDFLGAYKWLGFCKLTRNPILVSYLSLVSWVALLVFPHFPNQPNPTPLSPSLKKKKKEEERSGINDIEPLPLHFDLLATYL